MSSILSLYRLASGLRWKAGEPIKNTFIHYDDSEEEAADHDDVEGDLGRKYVSNIIDAAPAGWSRHAQIDSHIQNIVDLHRPGAQGAAARRASPHAGRDGADGGGSLRGLAECPAGRARCRSSRRAASRGGGRGAGGEAADEAADEAAPEAPEALEAPGRRAGRKRTRAAAPATEAARAAREEPVESVGSRLHAAGKCKPCAWNRKESGCFKGASCTFCHTCEDGAVQQRKKDRRVRVKECRKRAIERQRAAAAADGDAAGPGIVDVAL